MDELLRKVEILERCAAECLLIAPLVIDPDAQAENEELANECQAIAANDNNGPWPHLPFPEGWAASC